MADQKKENQHSVLMVGLFLLIGVQLVPFLSFNNLLPDVIKGSKFVIKLADPKYYYFFRILYIFIVIASFSLFISVKINKKIKKVEQPKYRKQYWMLSVLILLGTIQHPYLYYYNVLFFPVILLTHLFTASRGFVKLGNMIDEEDPLSKINQKPLKEMGLKFPTDKGELHVHNVFQGIMVQGGAGAGKSASVIEPSIYQWGKQNMSMCIYDFKGDPPTLGLMAYNTWLISPDKYKHKDKNGEETVFKKPKFQLLNIEQLELTVRPNPLSPKTMLSSMDTRSVTDTLMLTLNKTWIEKKDFWAESALNLAFAIAEKLRLDHPEYCTIPHLIELGTSDSSDLISFLRSNSTVEPKIRSFITAMDSNADQQIAGMFSSFQSPLTTLMTPELYWVFGAELEDQASVDVNNPEDPVILSISNNPSKKQALTPALSCLMRSIINTINQQGKHPCALVIDEFPTIYIQDFAQLPATARSNKISCEIGIQDESQLKSAYKTESDEIVSNMGTQFVGMTNNTKTAKTYSDLFGTYVKKDDSSSISDNSISISERAKDQKLLQAKDVSSQPVGHFVGKIADGAPSLFSVQIDEFKKKDYFPNWQKEINIPIEDEFIRNMFSEKNKPEINADMVFKQLVALNESRIKTEAYNLLTEYKNND